MRAHVLVVEDDPACRDLVTRVLEGEGYRVTAVESAAMALDTVRQEVPDLILSDIMMPGEDGYSLLEKIRAQPRLTFVPVIFLSALADSTSVERGHRVGVDQYLVKPFTPSQLVSTVSGTLRRYAELRQAQRSEPEPPALPVPASEDFIPTGIGPIDEQAGGLCQGRVYLVTGRVGTGKSVLAVQFLHGALAAGKGALLVTSERLESVLYVGSSVGLDLRSYVRSGRLVVAGIAPDFEYALESRSDIGGLVEEIEAYARDCGARRIVVSSITTILCSAPRLQLSVPLATDLIGGLERTGAITLLVGDEPVTREEELAEAYLKRTTFGTIVLTKQTEGCGQGVLCLDRMQGVPAELTGRPFRVVSGVGLASVGAAAAPNVYDELQELQCRVEIESISTGDDDTGLVPLPGGGYHLRDPFTQYVRDCLRTALKVTERCALLLLHFTLDGPGANGQEQKPDFKAQHFDGLLAPEEVLLWLRPGEIVILAMGADSRHGADLAGRVSQRLAELAAVRGQHLRHSSAVTVAYPEDGSTIDALLSRLDQVVGTLVEGLEAGDGQATRSRMRCYPGGGGHHA